MTSEVSLFERKPVRISGVLIDRDPSGAITVLHPMTGRSFVINEVGRRVLELSNGQKNIKSMVDVILSEFKGVDRNTAERDVADFVLGCVDAAIITWDEHSL